MINVKPVPAIALLIIFSLLAWVAFGGGSKDIADPDNVTIEPNDFIITFDGEVDYDFDTELTDIMFTYIDEELTLNLVDGEIVCSRPAEKAIEIIFKSLYVGYGMGLDVDVNDLPVRFPEPNEPECKGHGVNAIYCPECYSLDYLLELEESECKK